MIQTKEKWIRICPRCKSKKVRPGGPQNEGMLWICENCGFQSPLFLEEKEK